MSVVPRLVDCLQTFSRLESLEITIVVEKRDPPDFRALFPLCDLCGNRTTVVFIDPTIYYGVDFRTSWSQWIEKWDTAWKGCLKDRELG
jgi:hypothetical protein